MTAVQRNKILIKIEKEHFEIHQVITEYNEDDMVELEITFAEREGRTQSFPLIWSRIKRIAEEEECLLIPILQSDRNYHSKVLFISKDRVIGWSNKILELAEPFRNNYWVLQQKARPITLVNMIESVAENIATMEKRITHCQGDPGHYCKDMTLYNLYQRLKGQYVTASALFERSEDFAHSEIAELLEHAGEYRQK